MLDLTSHHVTAVVAFTATEQPLPGGDRLRLRGGSGPASGSATVRGDATGLPAVTFGAGYQALRVFDPVPAAFLEGTADVTGRACADKVDRRPPTAASLYAGSACAEPPTARRGRPPADRPGLACQNVIVVDANTLTCEGLAPEGDGRLRRRGTSS